MAFTDRNAGLLQQNITAGIHVFPLSFPALITSLHSFSREVHTLNQIKLAILFQLQNIFPNTLMTIIIIIIIWR